MREGVVALVAKVSAALAIGALVLVACSGGKAETGPVELESLVLQPSDLPPAFVRFDMGKIVFADLQPGPRAELSRFGRTGGWKAKYRRPGSRASTGALVVGSTVDSFATEDGAARDLEAYAAEFEAATKSDVVRGRLLDPPRVGDGAHAMTLLQKGGVSVRYFTVAWRQGNLSASVNASGFEGRLRFRDVVALARKQERRIATATG